MRIVVCTFLVVAAYAGPAAADGGTAEEQAACRPDVRKLCGRIGAGEADKYRECLQTHFSDLSQKCQKVLMNHQN